MLRAHSHRATALTLCVTLEMNTLDSTVPFTPLKFLDWSKNFNADGRREHGLTVTVFAAALIFKKGLCIQNYLSR